MKKYILASIYMFSLAVCAFSVPLERLVPANHASMLRDKNQGGLIDMHLSDTVPGLMPNHSGIRQSVMKLINTINPNMLVEVLYLCDKPAQAKTDSAVWDEKQKIIVFNQLTAIGTLTGIQYYSSSRKEMRIFYEYSSVMDPETKKLLPDTVFTQLPDTLTLYARQKDLTFGDNIYRYDYVNNTSAIFFTQENITALNYGVIPVIGKGNLRSVIAVIDCGDSILIYVASMAKAASVPGLYDKISASFSNRAKAVIHWFSERISIYL
jgi:hypothetical protein